MKNGSTQENFTKLVCRENLFDSIYMEDIYSEKATTKKIIILYLKELIFNETLRQRLIVGYSEQTWDYIHYFYCVQKF